MQRIIYKSKFFCDLCKTELPISLYGEWDTEFTAKEEPELIEWTKHFHWTDFHRVCAICGTFVKSGELELAVNDGKIYIYPDYTDEYQKITSGDRFGHLLIVHKKCTKNDEQKKQN